MTKKKSTCSDQLTVDEEEKVEDFSEPKYEEYDYLLAFQDARDYGTQ